jgi:hypothetical protein
MTPEVEFILSLAGAVLAAFLTWVAFARTKWAAN